MKSSLHPSYPEILTQLEKEFRKLEGWSSNEIKTVLNTCAKTRSLKFSEILKVIRYAMCGCPVGIDICVLMENVGKKSTLNRVNKAIPE